ncbi:DUF3040 domain-containing protein [Streptomyces sp. NPDC000070]|uniref:DUF3040 domain-containing protein n=1 Tax=Streptomyces sp. NPDC000070 TaxID=3154240 RepID=UPI00332BB5CE
MNPEMDEERILAQLERRLAQDDPALAATMTALNQQFPEKPGEQSDGGHDEEATGEEKQRNRWLTAATVFVIIAFLGLFITAVLNSNPQPADKDPVPPKGLAPGVSVTAQRRSPPRSAPRQRLPGCATATCRRRPVQEEPVRARDLAEPYVSLSKDADAIEAVRLIVERCLPGLLVTDPSGQPYAALPACHVVRTLVPGYVQEDRGLAALIDEPHADRLCRTLQGRIIADCLPVGRPFLPIADPDWTASPTRGVDGPQPKPPHRRGRPARPGAGPPARRGDGHPPPAASVGGRLTDLPR